MLPSLSGGHAGVVRMICGPNNLINVVAHTEETDKEIHELELIADAWIVAALEVPRLELYVVPPYSLKSFRLPQQLSLSSVSYAFLWWGKRGTLSLGFHGFSFPGATFSNMNTKWTHIGKEGKVEEEEHRAFPSLTSCQAVGSKSLCKVPETSSSRRKRATFTRTWRQHRKVGNIFHLTIPNTFRNGIPPFHFIWIYFSNANLM